MSPYNNLQKQSLPTLLLSNSFDEGRYNKPWSGGDWNEFQRGQNERRWNENVNQDINKKYSSSPGSGGGGPGGGGGDGCGLIVLVALALAIAIPSAVAAFVSSTIIILVAKRAVALFSNTSFREAYIASFWTTFTYLAAGNVIAFLQVWLYPTLNGWTEEISALAVVKYFYFPEGFHLVKPLHLIAFHVLCILLSSLILQNKMKEQFEGFTGYGRSITTTALVILPSLLSIFYLTTFLLTKYYLQDIH